MRKSFNDIGISEAEIRAKHSEEVRFLREKLKHQEYLLEEYRQSHGSISVFFSDLKNVIEVSTPPDPIYKPLKNKTIVKHSCTVCLHITDTHYGAVQETSEVEGFGKFSPEICANRSMEFIDSVVRWVKIHRTSYTIDEAAVIVTGDLISGDIHRELSVTNAFPVPVQIVGSAKLLASQVSELSKYF